MQSAVLGFACSHALPLEVSLLANKTIMKRNKEALREREREGERGGGGGGGGRRK